MQRNVGSEGLWIFFSWSVLALSLSRNLPLFEMISKMLRLQYYWKDLVGKWLLGARDVSACKSGKLEAKLTINPHRRIFWKIVFYKAFTPIRCSPLIEIEMILMRSTGKDVIDLKDNLMLKDNATFLVIFYNSHTQTLHDCLTDWPDLKLTILDVLK